MKLTKVQLDRARELRNTMFYDSLLGDYKSYKAAAKEYSKLAVQDIDAICQLPKPSANIPLLSRFGLRVLYIKLRDAFRIKTPEEKQLLKLSKELKVKQKLNKSV